VQLAGPASYFGVVHDKPTIGDDLRPPTTADITASTRLLTATSVAAFALAVVVAAAIAWRGLLGSSSITP